LYAAKTMDLVSDNMAETIIDALEVIRVQHEKGIGRRRSPRI